MSHDDKRYTGTGMTAIFTIPVAAFDEFAKSKAPDTAPGETNSSAEKEKQSPAPTE